jgi:GT2 family glycosyltransferase
MAPVVENPPSVLAVLVVRDAASWLRATLAALARQTHPRLGVLAVDNASTDGSPELLRSVLGDGRVLRLERNLGFGAAVGRALAVPAAAEADYVLVMHDDTVLAPDAVTRMVEAADRVPGVGLIGPKILDARRRGVLLEIGHASDRFGNPYSPLEEGEIDQGQYDATREVLFVSSAAMLVARDAWQRAGGPDERLADGHGDLDFGWRIRLAGFRVLMAPRAVVLHRLSGERGERDGVSPDRERFLSERAGLMSVLKNFRVVTLLWVLPMYLVQGTVRLVASLLGRRFDRVGQMLRAWGWNLLHLPGTVRRRARAQAVRHVPDREIAQHMVPASAGLRRWALRASSVLVARGEAHAEEDEEPEIQPIRRRVRSVVTAHPAGVGLAAGILITLIAFRDVLFVPHIEGGAFPAFPAGPLEFFREFAASWRSTGFGGAGGASPALVPLGVGSVLSLGDPQLLGRLLVAFGPLGAAVSCHRALRRLGVGAGAAVVGAACYGLSAVTLWSASEGRIAAIILVAVLPVIAARLWTLVDERVPAAPFRRAVATGMLLALVGSFFPAVWVSAAVLLLPALVTPIRGGNALRGGMLAVVSGGVAVALVFPFAIELAATGGGAGVDAGGAAPFLSLLRLAPGPSPGSSFAAFFVPLAGLVAFTVIPGDRGRHAWRSVAVGLAAAPLAWLAAAGHLPSPLANPVAFVAPGAVGLAFLVGMAADSAPGGLAAASFGLRHLAVVLLAAVVIAGGAVQTVRAIGAEWAVGESEVSAAWPLVSEDRAGGPFRVLWLGAPGAEAFPAPGGDPQGAVGSASAAVSYGITGAGGRSVLATGLPAEGAGYRELRGVLGAMLAGRVRHIGALLGPLGVRYVVTPTSLPAAIRERLEAQLDIDLVHAAAGLRIYRNARALPIGAAIPGGEAVSAARAGDLLAPVRLPTNAGALDPQGPQRWTGSIEGPGLVLVGVDDAVGWEIDGRSAFPAFGWAVGGDADAGPVSVAYRPGPRRALELAGMAVLWIAAVWVVRKRPPPRRRLVEARAGSARPTAEVSA